MDIPLTAGPWFALGAVLGILLAVAATAAVLLLRRRPPGAADAPEPDRVVEDDLPAFLEAPPGTAGAPDRRSGGWAVLAAPAPPPVPPAGTSGERHRTLRSLAVLGVVALVLVGAAAAVAAARSGADPPAASPAPAAPPAGVSAELSFAGIVLERHAVGVTVGYPRLRLTGGEGGVVAELELPTFNCLRADAPDDPEAAGCTPSVREHAELSTPELRVRGDAEGLLVTGDFATFRPRSGGAPQPTGRVHRISVRAQAVDGRAGERPEPAEGLLELGGEQVPTRAAEPNEISYRR